MAKESVQKIANEAVKDKKQDKQLDKNSEKASGEITKKELTDNELDSVTGGISVPPIPIQHSLFT